MTTDLDTLERLAREASGIRDVPLAPDVVLDLVRRARLGDAVIEAVGAFADDPTQIEISEDIHISDEGEPDRARPVNIVSDEHVEILSDIADGVRRWKEGAHD